MGEEYVTDGKENLCLPLLNFTEKSQQSNTCFYEKFRKLPILSKLVSCLLDTHSLLCLTHRNNGSITSFKTEVCLCMDTNVTILE